MNREQKKYLLKRIDEETNKKRRIIDDEIQTYPCSDTTAKICSNGELYLHYPRFLVYERRYNRLSAKATKLKDIVMLGDDIDVIKHFESFVEEKS